MDRIEWGGERWKHRRVCKDGELIRDEIVAADGTVIIDDVTDERFAPAIAEVPAMVAELRRMIGECSNEECEQCERHRAILARIDGGSNG